MRQAQTNHFHAPSRVRQDNIRGSDILVKTVYSMGNAFPSLENFEDLDPEEVFEDQVYEALKQYSYAFAIRASQNDSNLSFNPGRFEPGNNLYHVRVMVFRAFEFNEKKAEEDGRGPEPIYELDFEVAR